MARGCPVSENTTRPGVGPRDNAESVSVYDACVSMCGVGEGVQCVCVSIGMRGNVAMDMHSGVWCMCGGIQARVATRGVNTAIMSESNARSKLQTCHIRANEERNRIKMHKVENLTWPKSNADCGNRA